ncbi:MAG: M15 family metallopeptidase [Thalassotalea sp.]
MSEITEQQLFGLTDEHIHWLTPTIGVHHQMLASFKAMQLAAQKADIEITIASGFRSFDRQRMIWNKKALGQTALKDINGRLIDNRTLSEKELLQAILLYSALPGGSRHHWGTDIDVYSSSLLPQNQALQLEPWEYEPDGPFALLSQWLEANAHLYGFYFPYRKYLGGVAAEPWHLSYLPLAKQYEVSINAVKLSHVINQYNVALQHLIIANLNEITDKFILNINAPDKLISEIDHG